MDPTNLILGVPPMYVYAAATIGCVGLGWLAGPVLGSGVWKAVNRRNVKAMEAKDKGMLFVLSNLLCCMAADCRIRSVCRFLWTCSQESSGRFKKFVSLAFSPL